MWLAIGVVCVIVGFLAVVAGAVMMATEILAPVGTIVMIVGFILFFGGFLVIFAAVFMFFLTGIFCAPMPLFDVLDPSMGFAVSPGSRGQGLGALLCRIFCRCGQQPSPCGGTGTSPATPPSPEQLFEWAHGMVKGAQALFEEGRQRAEQGKRDVEEALKQQLPPEERERLEELEKDLGREADRLAAAAKQAAATAGRYAGQFFGRG